MCINLSPKITPFKIPFYAVNLPIFFIQILIIFSISCNVLAQNNERVKIGSNVINKASLQKTKALQVNLKTVNLKTVNVGDEIFINLSGEETLTKNFEVARDGTVNLPEVGAVEVIGLGEAALKIKITQALSLAFRNLNNLKVGISKQQRLIKISGYINSPGEILLPKDADIQTAFSMANGLRIGAQLDQIQLRSQGITTLFNYKKYLDTGDKNLLPQLISLDEIFVPASPKTGNIEVAFDAASHSNSGDAADSLKAIKIFGEVISPGSFTFNEGATLVDYLMRAGGVTRYASVEQIRVITNGAPILFNLKNYLDTGDSQSMPTMAPNTTIFIPIQEEEIKSGANMVYIMGEVFKPGAYEGKPGATFLDILANAGGPTRYAESRQIRLIRADGSVVPFDLSAFTEATGEQAMPKVLPGDAIFVPEKTDMNEKSWLKVAPSRAVRVLGEVVRPGRVEWSNEMSLLDLLAHTGGPTSRADTSRIEVIIPQTTGQPKKLAFNLDAFIDQGLEDSQLPQLLAGSTVRIHDLPQDPSDNKSQWVRQASNDSIYIFGQVGAPGRYRFTQAMHFLDILAAADGPTDKADISGIRINHRNNNQPTVSMLDLHLYFETGDEHLLPDVKPGDTIYIPAQQQLWLHTPKETTIRVLGAVNKPGRYRFDDSMTILDLLAEAGGTTQDAYIKKITVVNLSCCKDQATVFNLKKFTRTADFSQLPVLRVGDTIFVPNRRESALFRSRETMRDILQIVSLVALIGAL